MGIPQMLHARRMFLGYLRRDFKIKFGHSRKKMYLCDLKKSCRDIQHTG